MNSDTMKVGLRLSQTGKHHATKENIIHFAKAAENAGFDSLSVAAVSLKTCQRFMSIIIFTAISEMIKLQS